jgi:methylthioribose-1-phosphate isomerase
VAAVPHDTNPPRARGPDDPAGYRALRRATGRREIEVIDQRALPHVRAGIVLRDAADVERAIRDMWVRGAPLIGAVGAYGLAMALDADSGDAALARAHAALDGTRPTAVNLRWALDRVRARVAPLARSDRADAAWAEADAIVAEDIAINHAIGQHGLALIEAIAARNGGRPVEVMTHCNAGALATCGWGTATAPIYLAQARGIAVRVWVSETRPRLQGAGLTAWEMRERGIGHRICVDAAAGLLMRRGAVDIVLVGADRVAANGDLCNKIGTYDKALAAHDNGVPLYVGLPSPTLDAALPDGQHIPIETREAREVTCVHGLGPDGTPTSVRVAPPDSDAVNYAFDITPARLVTGFITERGIAPASRDGLAGLFPERYA